MVSFLLLHMISVAVAPLCFPNRSQRQDGERVFLRRQLGVFIVCLFMSDFIQSISGMIQIRWASQGGIDDGAACTIQAALLLAGDLGTCMWNAVVAVHTFMTIALRATMPNWVVAAIVVLGWSTLLLLALIGPFAIQSHELGPVYGIAGNWCFLTNNYADVRLWIHYIPILISLAFILILYVLLFLSLRGNLLIHEGRITIRRRSSVWSVAELPSPHLTAVAKRMLWYPISYVVIVLPITVARLASLHGDNVPQWVWNFAITLLFLSGFINVIIYTSTRQALSPLHWSAALFGPRKSHSRNSSSTSSQRGRVGNKTSSKPSSPTSRVFQLGSPLRSSSRPSTAGSHAGSEARISFSNNHTVWIGREPREPEYPPRQKFEKLDEEHGDMSIGDSLDDSEYYKMSGVDGEEDQILSSARFGTAITHPPHAALASEPSRRGELPFGMTRTRTLSFDEVARRGNY